MRPPLRARGAVAKRVPRAPSILVETLKVFLKVGGFPPPVEEHRFHVERQWRFDLAFPDRKLAIECEGGVHSGGRHVRGKGYEGDCEKYNEAVLMGWRVLRFTMGMINDRRAIDQIRRAYENRGRAADDRDLQGDGAFGHDDKREALEVYEELSAWLDGSIEALEAEIEEDN